MSVRSLVAVLSDAPESNRLEKARELISHCRIESPVHSFVNGRFTLLYQSDVSATSGDASGTLPFYQCRNTGNGCLVLMDSLSKSEPMKTGAVNNAAEQNYKQYISSLNSSVIHAVPERHQVPQTALIWLNGQLHLQRSMTGEHTLVFMRDGDDLLISHDELALLRCKTLKFSVNHNRIACHLALSEPDPATTWFNEIRQVRPMHAMTFCDSGSTERRIDSIACKPDLSTRSDDLVAHELLSTLDQAISSVTEPTDERIAIAVSGGMDSSSVAASVLSGSRWPSEQVQLYSWSFPEYPECDETEWVNDLAAKHGTSCSAVICQDCEPLGSAFDEIEIPLLAPIVDAYRVMRKRLSDQALNDGHTHMLTGDFGDHLYLGQHYHLRDARKARRPGAWTAIRAALGKHGFMGFRRDSAMRRLLPLNGWSRRFRKTRVPWMKDKKWTMLDEGAHRFVNDIDESDRVEACLSPSAVDLARYGRFLSLEWGVKQHYPLWNSDLIRFVLNLPAYLLTDPVSGQTKLIMRQAMHDRLPSSIINRQGKTTFESIFRAGVLDKHQSRTRNIINHPNAAWHDFLQPDWLGPQLDSMQFSNRGLVVLWQIISLQLWIDELPANIGT